jgi:hypothetical protein
MTITGSGITLVGSTIHNGNTTFNGNATLSSGGDLLMGNTGTSANHIVANGDVDLAGQLTFSVPTATSGSPTSTQQTVPFQRPYVRLPIVVLTLATPDPWPGSASSPKYSVTLNQDSQGRYTSFTINFVIGNVPASATPSFSETVNYHVIAS